MTRPNSTEVIVIVDRSASMRSIAPDMERGFASFLAEQRQAPGECRMTIVQFDNEYEVLCTAALVDMVPALRIMPRGSTSLLDAIGRTIQEAGERFRVMREKDRPARVVVVVITDGEENTSSMYNLGQVTLMISHQRARYAWEFIFLGANQDAIKVASHMGINNALTYTPDSASVGAMFNAASEGVIETRTSGKMKTSGELRAKYVKDGGK